MLCAPKGEGCRSSLPRRWCAFGRTAPEGRCPCRLRAAPRLFACYSLTKTMQDCCCLRSCGVAPRHQVVVAALDQTGAVSPLHRRHGPFADRQSIRIGKDIGILAHAHIIFLVLCVAPENRRKLLTGNRIIRAELGGRVSAHNAIAGCPANGLGIIHTCAPSSKVIA